MTPNQFAWNVVQARRTLPYGQRPTDLHIRIAFILARWQHASPCHAKLARAAHCHRRSIGNALHRLRDLGFICWEKQFVRIGHGYVAQTANRYSFEGQPSLPLAPKDKGCAPRKDHSYVYPIERDRSADLAALAAVRAAREARLTNKGVQTA